MDEDGFQVLLVFFGPGECAHGQGSRRAAEWVGGEVRAGRAVERPVAREKERERERGTETEMAAGRAPRLLPKSARLGWVRLKA